MDNPTSATGSPLVGEPSPSPSPLPGTQPQPASRPPLPGVNVPNPPPIVATGPTPKSPPLVPADFNQFAAIAAAVFEALAVGGPDAAQRLLTWAQHEKAK